MTTHLRRLSAITAAAALLMVGGGSSANAATALPAHVYAPYFETWTTDGIAANAQQSGAQVLHAGVPRDPEQALVHAGVERQQPQTIASGRYLRTSPPPRCSAVT